MAHNKYHQILARILDAGKRQANKKGNITYLVNECMSLTPADLLDIFEGHGLALIFSHKSTTIIKQMLLY